MSAALKLEAKRERASRKMLTRSLYAELHQKQRDVARDTARYIALLCGRRSGKTELMARMIAVALIHCGFNEWVLYACRTQAIAKDLMWGHLEAINERYQLGWRMTEQTGMIRTPNGGRFRLFGVDDRKAREKVRGYKARRAFLDEASTYQDELEKLIQDCLSPALTDLGGGLVLAGTPGSVCVGYWFRASTGEIPAYSCHHWTVRQNPKFPRDVEEMLAEERANFAWTEESPSYRREWLAEWVDDESALVYMFVRERNAVDAPEVAFDPKTWLTTLGVDFGMTDHCGWVVLGSPPGSRSIYVLWAEKHTGLLPNEAAKLTADLYGQFQCARIYADGGGLGKPYVEEFNRRWADSLGVRMTPADKADKVGTISLLNGDLRSKALLVLPDAEAYAGEVQFLPWLDERRTKEHPGFANHLADAGLYAWKGHKSYWQKPPPPDKPKDERPPVLRAIVHAAQQHKRNQKRPRKAAPWGIRRAA